MNSLDFLFLRSPLQSLNQAENEPKINSVFNSAIQIAAPELFSELIKIDSANVKDKQKINNSVKKYWLRSCSRCTPFGIFAGSSIIHLTDDKTSIILDKNDQHMPRARLDMSYLLLIKTEIEKKPEIFSQLLFRKNDSLYETFLGFRYAEFIMKGDIRHYILSSIEKTQFVAFLLKITETPILIKDLIQKFSAQYPQFTDQEASDFIFELWTAQILISHLELNITGNDPLSNLIKNISNIKGAERIAEQLQKIDTLLKNVCSTTNFEQLKTEITTIFPVEKPIKDILQVDLELRTKENGINRKIINEIVKQCSELTMFSRKNNNVYLDNFKSKFIERFDGAEVPLNLVMDVDLGIGYGEVQKGRSVGSEWVDDLPVGFPSVPPINYRDQITDFAFKKYQECIKNNNFNIEIEVDELKRNTSEKFNYASSSYLMGSLILKRTNEGDDFVFDVQNIGGPSAANLLGRFTIGNDKLSQLTRGALLEEEKQYPNAIFAEIVHSPQDRIGNVLLRSNLRTYEIPYLGASGIDIKQQILIDDIMISIKHSEVVLRSKKHNKRLFPRLSTAHNFTNNLSLPIYRFLCDLQYQGLARPLIWDWGFLGDVNFYPRVSYKNLILKKAKWILLDKEVEKKSAEKVELVGLEALLRKRGIPKMVMFVQGDNNLLINLEDSTSLKILLAYLNKYKTIVLEEFLFDVTNCIVSDLNNLPYTNEMIIPLQNEVKEQVDLGFENIVEMGTQRKFPPSSDWLYFKLYGGEKSLEHVLLNNLFPFIKDCLKTNAYEKFFFIRYTDKLGVNLRLRFYNSNREKQVELQSQIMTILSKEIETGRLENITIETYVREIERYSEKLMVHSETIFFYDSLAVLECNEILTEVEDSNKYRLLFAMRRIEMLCEEFTLNLEEKSDLMKTLHQGYFSEFGGHSNLKRTLNDKYRKIQKEIFSHMKDTNDIDNGIEEVIDIFKSYDEMKRPTINAIIIELEKNKSNLVKLLANYIHMFMNRLFITKQRKYELLVYTFLERYYTSEKAILIKKNKL
jgi:thiopeptide-type bacteriocin biosynthesis protein